MIPPIRLRMFDDHLKRLRSVTKIAKTLHGNRREFRDGGSAILYFVFDLAVVLSSADAVHAVQACQDEFDAGSSDRFVVACVDLKGQVPCRRDTLQTFGVGPAGQQITDLDTDTATKYLGDFTQAVLFDIFAEDDFDRLGDDGV